MMIGIIVNVHADNTAVFIFRELKWMSDPKIIDAMNDWISLIKRTLCVALSPTNTRMIG